MKSVGTARAMARCKGKVWVDTKTLVIGPQGNPTMFVMGPETYKTVLAHMEQKSPTFARAAETARMAGAPMCFGGVPVQIDRSGMLDAHWERKGHPLRSWAYRFLRHRGRHR